MYDKEALENEAKSSDTLFSGFLEFVTDIMFDLLVSIFCQ